MAGDQRAACYARWAFVSASRPLTCNACGLQAGRPRVFISHGTNDQVLPCDRCGRRLARELKADGLTVDYREFKGPHAVPAAISQQGMQWFLGSLESATELVQQKGHKVVPI